MTSTTKYIDITPTWSEILPALIALTSMPQTREDALMELSRMAKLADAQVAFIKAGDK
jgi:hypothetical protein